MRLLLFIFLFVFTFCDRGYSQNTPAPQRTFKLPDSITSKDYVPGIVIIKFRPGNAASIKRLSSTEGLSALLKNISNVKIESVLQKFSSTGENNVASVSNDTFGLDRIYQIKFSGAGIEEVINELLKDEQIEYAEPNYIYRMNYIPNDPSFSNEQNYLAQVKAPQAWDIIRSASSVVIGIIDSGSDLDHPDLAGNIYINTSDPPDGIDNDGDGYVDNYKGWDLIGLSGNNPIQDNDPSVKNDSNSHGVHVSGLASAVSNNGIGVASIAFDAKLLIVKVGADNDANSVYSGFDGIKYAADHGAKIINCSWGGYSFSSMGQDIINYTLSKDILIVAAAGNENSTSLFYPASYSGVISVTSVNSNDVKSTFSNSGERISISAPGSNIYSTIYNDNYTSFSGTSMASPLVASAAALLKAYHPSYPMQQIGQLLLASADNINANNPDYNGKLGSGRLNIFKALMQPFVQIITFASLPAKTYGDADFDPGATINSGLPISYASSNTGVATIVNGKIHITGAGSTTITASQSGDASHMEAPSVSRTLTVNKASQTISFAPIPTRIYGDADFDPGAIASSGLTVTYTSLNTNVATIVNGKIHITGVGTDSIVASQGGNANYHAAASAVRLLTVNKASQIISFDPVPVQVRGGPAYTLKATSSSGLPVSFSSSDPFVAAVSNSSLSPLRVGKVVLTAIQAGNMNYLPATPVSQQVQVTDLDGSVVKILAAVSPNSDGINDFLTIEGIRDYTVNQVSVFTRNGAKVFHIDNYDNSDHVFRGLSKDGGMLPQGTYFYLLQFMLEGHQQHKRGYFVLKYQ